VAGKGMANGAIASGIFEKNVIFVTLKFAAN